MVAIVDAVSEEAAPYLVMEYVPGVTLKHFCRSDRLLPLDQIVELGFKCAMALSYVYRQGVIHRDVKPANLLAVLTNGGGLGLIARDALAIFPSSDLKDALLEAVEFCVARAY